MNGKDEALRKSVAENLRFAEQLSQRVGRIRDLFEERLKEHPLYYWNPSIRNLRRQELWGYAMGSIEGEFKVEEAVGQYNLSFIVDGVDLPNSGLEIFGTIGGHEAFDYVLPPIADIANRNREQLEKLQAKVDYLEAILELIGVFPDGEVDPEEM